MNAPAPRRVWFIDTSSLMTIAVSCDLKAQIQAAIGTDAIVLLDVVVDELAHRATFDGLAATAHGDLAWLGPPADTNGYVRTDQVEEIQQLIADGKTLKDPFEHWAESVTIAMLEAAAARGSAVECIFLTEDYSARVQANKVDRCTPKSVHRVLYERVQDGDLTAAEAESLAETMRSQCRGQDYTAEEFADPNRYRALRRVGEP